MSTTLSVQEKEKKLEEIFHTLLRNGIESNDQDIQQRAAKLYTTPGAANNLSPWEDGNINLDIKTMVLLFKMIRQAKQGN